MAAKNKTVESVRRNNVEFGVWRESFRRAHENWSGAPNQLKAPLLLTGKSLVRAENWLLEFPQQLSESEKQFIIDSLSHRPAKKGQRNQHLIRARQHRLLANLASSWVVWACVFFITWFVTADELRVALKSALEAALMDPVPESHKALIKQKIAAARIAKSSPASDLPTVEPNLTDGADSLSDPFDTTAGLQDGTATTENAAPAVPPEVAERSQRMSRLNHLVALAGGSLDRGNVRYALQLALEAHEDLSVFSDEIARLSVSSEKSAAATPDAATSAAGTTTLDDQASTAGELKTISSAAIAIMSRALGQSNKISAHLTTDQIRPASAVCGTGRSIVNVLQTGALQGGLIATDPAVLAIANRHLLPRPDAFSADCNAIILTTEENVAELWSLATGKRMVAFAGHEASLIAAALSPDGRLALTASQDATARLWNTATGRQIALLDLHDQQVTSAAFSPDSSLALTASSDRTARIWDTRTGRQIKVLRGHLGKVTDAVFSPDGGQILTTAWDGVARIWDTGTGDLLHAIKPAGGAVMSATYGANGQRVITLAQSGEVHIWAPKTGTETAALPTKAGKVRNLAVSSDGRRLLTISWNGQLSLWNAETGQNEATLSDPAKAVAAAAFGPDDRIALAMTRAGDLYSWPLSGEDDNHLRLARQSAGACLSETERTALGLVATRAGWCASVAAVAAPTAAVSTGNTGPASAPGPASAADAAAPAVPAVPATN